MLLILYAAFSLRKYFERLSVVTHGPAWHHFWTFLVLYPFTRGLRVGQQGAPTVTVT